MNPFLQLAAEKKDSKNGAARKFFGPSYFVMALMVLLSIHFNKLPSSNQSDLASTALAGAARPHLKKLGDQASVSKSDFKCCTHCNGQVQVV